MFYLANRGYRCIAHDRRGHGRSSQPLKGNDMDTYADDLAELCTRLDLRGAVLVGHSTGGGEIVRYIGRHGTGRVGKVVLIGAIPPFMLKTLANPLGTPISAFDAIRTGVATDRSQFFAEFSLRFYGYNRPGVKVSQGVCDAFWRLAMQASLPACHDCIKAFSETDFTQDLSCVDVPTLVMHGDDDQIVPIAISAERTATLVKNSELVVVIGGSHGLCTTHKARVNAELERFISSDGIVRQTTGE
jgi:non-heme chloroperoxidase